MEGDLQRVTTSIHPRARAAWKAGALGHGVEEANGSSGGTQDVPSPTKGTGREKAQRCPLLNTAIATAPARDSGTGVQRPEAPSHFARSPHSSPSRPPILTVVRFGVDGVYLQVLPEKRNRGVLRGPRALPRLPRCHVRDRGCKALGEEWQDG